LGIRLVIADEQRIGREGLRALFAAEQDIEIVGEASDGRSAVRATEDLTPDVVLFGLEMMDLSAVDATRQIKGLRPSVRVIGLADVVNARLVRELLAAGGAGFITRRNAFADFVNAIRAVMERRIYLSPDVAQAMVDQYILGAPAAAAGDGIGTLTPREREVLQHISSGMSTREAAAELKISTKTVDMHRQRMMSKLKIRSIAELTKFAIREGITALHS
jgi:DNA-binding NarL/FixJ family response regulator